MREQDIDRCVEFICDLCRIPSPTGYTERVSALVLKQVEEFGFKPTRTRKGSVLCDLGGSGTPLVLAAHVDTLGAMVRSVKSTGRLRYTPLGAYPALYVLTESCELHTRDGRTYTGTFQPVNPAVHVNTKLADFKPTEENTEIVLDLPVSSAEEVAGYGIRAGDIISLDPRTTVSGGFIKSRHLDDKASAGVLLSLAALVADGEIELGRRVHLLFTTYEEVGHGGSAGIPADTEEMISVDMGAVGDDLLATEHQVSICAKDSGGPYDYAVTSALIDAAEQSGASYSVDIYPRYGSDVEATLRAGFDIRHGLIGPGVSASHGYERTHRDGVEATLALLAHYVSQRGREA